MILSGEFASFDGDFDDVDDIAAEGLPIRGSEEVGIPRRGDDEEDDVGEKTTFLGVESLRGRVEDVAEEENRRPNETLRERKRR